MIRLANNNLVDTTGLYQMALDVVEFPEDIAWLDLSFNEISDVSDDILEFPGMSVITTAAPCRNILLNKRGFIVLMYVSSFFSFEDDIPSW